MYISFYLQWDVGSSPSVERWCILLSSSSVVRRCISPSTSSGTLVVHLQWNVGLFCYHHRQWYVDELHLLISSVVRWYIFLSCLQWNVGMCYRQWYGGTSLSSSVVRRRIISFYIVSGTAVYLFHRQWYVDETFLFYIISGMVVYLLNTFSGTW